MPDSVAELPALRSESPIGRPLAAAVETQLQCTLTTIGLFPPDSELLIAVAPENQPPATGPAGQDNRVVSVRQRFGVPGGTRQ